jgi:short-subunit dehydrogenase
MKRWQGRWAVVTGASAGIGRELARRLAAEGVHLVLVARRTQRLQELAAQLCAQHRIQAEVFPADLSEASARDALLAFTRERDIAVELLINNAGFGAYGEFWQLPLARQLEMIQVNIAAVVHLTHLFLPQMIERRRGDILVVASVAAFQAVPYISTYAATKAFDLLFAEGLAEEVRGYGIRVCALCPGSTHTEFREVAGQPERTFRVAEEASQVARVGLAALAAGRTCVISGMHNRLTTLATRFVPRGLVTRMAARLFAPAPR